MDGAHETATSISEAARNCLQSLQECLHLPLLMHHEWAENRLAEFKLWADGVGAFASDRASLDMRLAMEWETKNLVMSILILLQGCIETCISAGIETQSQNDGQGFSGGLSEGDEQAQYQPDASSTASTSQENLSPPADLIPRSFSPWSDTSSTRSDSDDAHPIEQAGDSLPELDALQSEVEQIIDHLARLGVAIRKSGANTRSQKADRLFREEDHSDLFRHLAVVVLGRGSINGRQDGETNPALLSPIQQRLIRANLRRRNRFLYAQRHARKLALSEAMSSAYQSSPPVFDVPAFVGEFRVPEIAVAQDISITEETLEIDAPAIPLRMNYPTPFTATSASAVGTTIQGVPSQMTPPSQLAKTTITSTAAKILYPRPPQLRGGMKYFKCPCCCQTLPALYHERTHWKKHLMEDISPYTCIVDDCPHPDLLHRSRRAWMQHVERDHHQCWECLPCKTPERVPLLFSSVEELISHTRQVHNDSIKEDQYATLAAAASRIAPSGISQCPLCNETGTADSDALFDHIAEHVHSFSLYSLPWPKDENDDLDEASYDYFQDNDFFDTGEVAGSDDSTLSTDSQGSSGLGSLPSNRDLARPRLTLEIPDQPVRKLKFSLEVGFPRETPDSSSQVSPVSENDSEPVTDHYLGRPEKKKSFPIPETDSFKVVILGPEICVNQVLRNGSLKPISAEDEGQFIASWVRWQPSTEWATGPPRTFIMSGYSAVDDYSDVSLTKRALSRTRDVLSRTGRALLGSRFERRKPEPEAPLVRYGPLSPRTLVPLYGPRLTDSFKEVVSGPDLCSGQILVNGLLAPEPEWEEDPQRLIWAKWEPFLTWQARSTYQNHSTRKLYY